MVWCSPDRMFCEGSVVSLHSHLHSHNDSQRKSTEGVNFRQHSTTKLISVMQSRKSIHSLNFPSKSSGFVSAQVDSHQAGSFRSVNLLHVQIAKDAKVNVSANLPRPMSRFRSPGLLNFSSIEFLQVQISHWTSLLFLGPAKPAFRDGKCLGKKFDPLELLSILLGNQEFTLGVLAVTSRMAVPRLLLVGHWMGDITC